MSKLLPFKDFILQSKALGHGSRKIAKELGVSKTSINNYLRSLSFVQEDDIDVDNTQDNSRFLNEENIKLLEENMETNVKAMLKNGARVVMRDGEDFVVIDDTLIMVDKETEKGVCTTNAS